MEYYPEVIQAVAGDNKNIYIYFSDGRICKYNMNSLIKGGGIFKKLENNYFFRNNLTVMNGTAAWDLTGKHDPAQCIDIDPFTLYAAEKVKDPLEEAG